MNKNEQPQVSEEDIKVTDNPDESEEDIKVTDNPDETYIVHRTADGDIRMPISEWAEYAKENGL